MILTDEIKIKKVKNMSNDFFENEFNRLGFNVLRWAIVDYDDENFIVSVAHQKH